MLKSNYLCDTRATCLLFMFIGKIILKFVIIKVSHIMMCYLLSLRIRCAVGVGTYLQTLIDNNHFANSHYPKVYQMASFFDTCPADPATLSLEQYSLLYHILLLHSLSQCTWLMDTEYWNITILCY